VTWRWSYVFESDFFYSGIPSPFRFVLYIFCIISVDGGRVSWGSRCLS
jgi:hypothetical protein